MEFSQSDECLSKNGNNYGAFSDEQPEKFNGDEDFHSNELAQNNTDVLDNNMLEVHTANNGQSFTDIACLPKPLFLSNETVEEHIHSGSITRDFGEKVTYDASVEHIKTDYVDSKNGAEEATFSVELSKKNGSDSTASQQKPEFSEGIADTLLQTDDNSSYYHSKNCDDKDLSKPTCSDEEKESQSTLLFEQKGRKVVSPFEADDQNPICDEGTHAEASSAGDVGPLSCSEPQVADISIDSQDINYAREVNYGLISNDAQSSLEMSPHAEQPESGQAVNVDDIVIGLTNQELEINSRSPVQHSKRPASSDISPLGRHKSAKESHRESYIRDDSSRHQSTSPRRRESPRRRGTPQRRDSPHRRDSPRKKIVSKSSSSPRRKDSPQRRKRSISPSSPSRRDSPRKRHRLKSPSSPSRRDSPRKRQRSKSPSSLRRRDSHRRRNRSKSQSPSRRNASTRERRDRHGKSRSRSPYSRDHRRSPRHSSRGRSPISSRHSHRRSPRRPWSPPPNRKNGLGKPGRTLFVAGFSYAITERDLRKKFSTFGHVIDARVVRDRRTGDSRGFGFLSLEKDEEADEAIRSLDETEWNGRIILVEKSKSGVR